MALTWSCHLTGIILSTPQLHHPWGPGDLCSLPSWPDPGLHSFPAQLGNHRLASQRTARNPVETRPWPLFLHAVSLGVSINKPI